MLTGGEGLSFEQSSVARLLMVSGDRQIAVNTHLPPQPYVVRAVDVRGAPVSGVGLIIEWTGGCAAPNRADEFGYRGFNATVDSACFATGPRAEYLAGTDANGYGTTQGRYADGPPSAFLVGARALNQPLPVPAIYFTVVATTAPPAGNATVIVEYFEKDLGHYFNTLLQSEIDALEAGTFAGWQRSTGAFIAYATAQDAPPGAVPVCRFFSSTYTSHFYTADAGECDAVVARWPDVWQLETRAAFYIQVPDKTTGACGPGLQPIYRMYSTRNGPNHRYVADSKLRDAMVRAGWASEGYGPDNVMLCTAR